LTDADVIVAAVLRNLLMFLLGQVRVEEPFANAFTLASFYCGHWPFGCF
jgi:hypothetical protein